jgi:hypothetical protein
MPSFELVIVLLVSTEHYSTTQQANYRHTHTHTFVIPVTEILDRIFTHKPKSLSDAGSAERKVRA